MASSSVVKGSVGGTFSLLKTLLPVPLRSAHSSQPPSALSSIRSALTIQSLLAANLHLGHSPSAWNPNMNQYIYGERNGIHIINLDHTLTALKRALSVTKEVALEGGHILFVGSRPALHSVVVQAALEGNAYYVHQWKGGLITNKERVLRRSVGFDPDKVVQESRVLLTATDSEAELEAALNSAKGGAKTQPYVHSPDLIILLDTPNNSWAIHEANFAGIPVIAVCDTDCDPAKVQYPIPANDDSLLGLKLIAGVLSRAAKEGSERRAILQAELKKTGGEGNNNNKDKKKNRRH